MARFAGLLTLRRSVVAVAIVVAAAVFSSCGMPFSYGFDGVWTDEPPVEEPPEEEVETGPLSLTVRGTQFSIGWDDDGDTDTFHVYHRPRGAEDWSFLASVPSGTTLIVTTAMLPYGEYEFAVTSVEDAVESGYHTSLDETANPNRGWYLRWEPSV